MQSNKHNRKPHCYVTIGSKLDGVSVQPGSVASLQSISCNVPVYTGNEFVLGAPGATCPVGFDVITEQATCQRANDELTAGLWGFGGNPMIGNWGNRPSGCFLQEKGYWKLNGSVMFNNHRAGVAQPGDRIICGASTGPAPTGSCAASNTRPASFCGYDTQFTNGERLTLLGDWRTESCVSKCNTYLNGREGCCLQTVNRIGCYAVAGGASDGVAVRPLTTGVIDSLQATHCA